MHYFSPFPIYNHKNICKWTKTARLICILDLTEIGFDQAKIPEDKTKLFMNIGIKQGLINNYTTLQLIYKRVRTKYMKWPILGDYNEFKGHLLIINLSSIVLFLPEKFCKIG